MTVVLVALGGLDRRPGAVLGSFTTFSAFSLATVTLLQQARLVEASLNVAGSLGVCLVAVVSGLYVGQRRTPQR